LKTTAKTGIALPFFKEESENFMQTRFIKDFKRGELKKCGGG